MKVFRVSAASLLLIALLVFVAFGSCVASPLLVVQRPPTRAVNRVAFSPDGKIMATVGQDHLVRLWQSSMGYLLRTLVGHGAPIRALAFDPDGGSLITGDDNGKLCTWETNTGRLLGSTQLDAQPVSSVACSADGKFLAVGCEDGARIFARPSWDVAKFFPTTRPVTSVEFSPDGNAIACGTKGRVVSIFDRMTGEETRHLEGHNGSIGAIHFSADARQLLSASEDGSLRLWNLVSGELASQSVGDCGPILDAQYSPDHKTIASVGEDGVFRIWSSDLSREVHSLTLGSQALGALAWRPGSIFAAVGAADGSLDIVDTRAGKLVRAASGAPDRACVTAVSSNGRRIAIADGTTGIRLFELDTITKSTVLPTHGESVESLAFSPDGTLLASGGDDFAVRIWNADNATEKVVLRGHLGAVGALTFSSDGTMLASGARDGVIEIWDVAAGSELSSMSGVIRHDSLTGTSFPPIQIIRALEFNKDATVLASASDDAALIWRTVSGEQLAAWTQDTSAVTAVAFSPDGLELATGNASGDVNIATVAQRRLLGHWAGGAVTPVSLSFSADGKRLLCGGDDGTLTEIGNDGSPIKSVPTGEPNVSAEFHYASGRVVTASATGVIGIWDATDLTSLASLSVFDDGDWAVIARDAEGNCFVDGTKRGLDNVHWVTGNTAVGVGDLSEPYNSPGIVGRLLSGGAVPSAVTEAVSTGSPPTVTLTRRPHEPKGLRGTLIVDAADHGAGIETIELYQNGQLIVDDVVGEPAHPKAVSKTYAIDLLPGKNNFRALATGFDGIETLVPAMLTIDAKP